MVHREVLRSKQSGFSRIVDVVKHICYNVIILEKNLFEDNFFTCRVVNLNYISDISKFASVNIFPHKKKI